MMKKKFLMILTLLCLGLALFAGFLTENAGADIYDDGWNGGEIYGYDGDRNASLYVDLDGDFSPGGVGAYNDYYYDDGSLYIDQEGYLHITPSLTEQGSYRTYSDLSLFNDSASYFYTRYDGRIGAETSYYSDSDDVYTNFYVDAREGLYGNSYDYNTGNSAYFSVSSGSSSYDGGVSLVYDNYVNSLYSGFAADDYGLRAGSFNYDNGTLTGLYAGNDNVSVAYTDLANYYSYGMYADNSVVTVGYRNYDTGVDHGLAVYEDYTVLSGGTSTTTLTLNDDGAYLDNRLMMQGNNINMGGGAINTIGGNVNLGGGNLNTGGGNVNMGGGNINNVNNLTVNGTTTLNGGASIRSTSGLFGMDTSDSLAQLGYQSGTLTNGVQATADGVVLSSTDTAAYSSTVRLDNTQAYISYNDGTWESGLEAGPTGLIVGSNSGNISLGMSTDTTTNEMIVGYIDASTSEAYGLHASDSEVNVGYLNGTDFHGLTVTGTQTILSGGTNSSSLTLDDTGATLAVGNATDPEETVLTATNTAGVTDITITSDTLNISSATTINNTLDVIGDTTITGALDVTGDVYIDGNLDITGTFTVGNLSVVDLTTTGNTILGDDATDSTAVNGSFLSDSNGTATAGGNRLSVTASGVNAISDNNSAGLEVSNGGAYIGYDNGSTYSGLLAESGRVVVGNTDTSTNTAYGLIADTTEAMLGYVGYDGAGNVTDFHGLTVTGTQTILSGGTNSSSLTLDDTGATLAVGNATDPEETVLTATNTAGVTDITISSNTLNISSATTINNTLDVIGDTTITGALDVSGETSLNDRLLMNGNNINMGGGSINTIGGNVNLGGGALNTGGGNVNLSGGNVNMGGGNINNVNDLTVNGTTTMNGPTTVNNTFDVNGDTNLNGTLSVAGATTLNDTLNVTGATTLNDTLDVAGATTLQDTLDVYGATNIYNTFAVDSNGATPGGSTLTVNDSQVTALTADGSGLTVNDGGVVALKNSVGDDGYGPGHGLTINPDSTVLSGGTTSTTLTLNDDGATFANTTTGGPARVTGVAAGVNPYDAVNVSQIRGLERDIQRAHLGIASVSALSAIPGVAPCKRFAIGAGYGYFEGENAVAVGLKARLWDNVNVQAGLGFGIGYKSDSTYSANAGFSYSF